MKNRLTVDRCGAGVPLPRTGNMPVRQRARRPHHMFKAVIHARRLTGTQKP